MAQSADLRLEHLYVWPGTTHLEHGPRDYASSGDCASRIRQPATPGRRLTPERLLLRHVVPRLRTLLPVLFAFEIGATLLALGELGFLGFYFGGAETRSVARGDTSGTWNMLVPGQSELAQMLSGGWQNIFQTPWMVAWAGSAFFFSILAFTMLGEGLRRRVMR